MDYLKKFQPEKNIIKEFDNWIILLREKQVTLGSAIVAPKRKIARIPELNVEEATEIPIVIAWYEKKCEALFGSKKTNYVVAMMKDNFVHFHAFPRYDKSFSKYGITWEDKCWPKVIQFENVKYDEAVLELIRNDLRE